MNQLIYPSEVDLIWDLVTAAQRALNTAGVCLTSQQALCVTASGEIRPCPLVCSNLLSDKTFSLGGKLLKTGSEQLK